MYLALSKNDSKIISTSGGQVSLFNIETFETMATFMHPPSMPMYVSIYPYNNNIIAIGMDDSTVLIYDARANEVKSKQENHSKLITDLAFSSLRNLLVSAGTHDSLIVWQCNKWISKKSCLLQLPPRRSTRKLRETEVQFHQDQKHFLALHELKVVSSLNVLSRCRLKSHMKHFHAIASWFTLPFWMELCAYFVLQISGHDA
ncbi:topless-related protein 1-like [Camellia sinensis]|uniref:topless-related protein 1-like n=1 Tax=Camellia sinensis TaxID=4442 RepID=UPI001036E222|nr:topless-related protein 1-like [Camellia sinensis]XP_028118998.1 topless-related protein 1-like [Camellia sinensis]